MEIAVGVLVAVVVVLAAGLLMQRRAAARRDEAQSAAAADLLATLRPELASLQQQALQQNNEQFMALAKTQLGAETARGEEQLRARGEAIEKGLTRVGETLDSMKKFVREVDAERGKSITELKTLTEASHRTMQNLGAETARLQRALSGGQTRGQWGERMAEDVLRVAGMLEGLNYRKNRQVEGGSGRPDYTFLLPQDRVLHMDVKFPLAGYLRYLEAGTEADRETATSDFLRDVRQRVREVTTRDYIDPTAGTLDYVLVFIPNEQVYGFIHQHDATIAQSALERRVVLCSPLTLFAVLAVIRQSVESVRLEEHAHEILAALDAFQREWGKYQDAVETVGRRITSAQTAYGDLSGTRTRQLERQLDKVKQLRAQTGIDAGAELASGDAPEELPARVDP